jgi:hypothetical protein
MSRVRVPIGIKTPAVETSPGIFEEAITETIVSGDMEYKPIRWSVDELAQDSARLNHTFSFISRGSVKEDFSNAVYLVYQGKKWTVSTISYLSPRIKFTLGGIYNG